MNDSEMIRALSRIRVVLAGPRDAENVGSVCRAMKTMGMTDLRITGKTEFDRERAIAVAVHAADVLDGCNCHTDVSDAVKGCTLVAGSTRRWGKKRKLLRMTPEAFADRIVASNGADIAIVFGNESSGLSDSELAACHVAVTIPSSIEARSLNLSHAVQILCYEVYRAMHEAAGKRFYIPVSGEILDTTIERIRESLTRIDDGNERFIPLLRDILARSAPSREEVKRFEALFAKLSGMARKSDS